MGHWAGLLAHSTEQLTLRTACVDCSEYIELYNQMTPFTAGVYSAVYIVQPADSLYSQGTLWRVHCIVQPADPLYNV